MNDKKVVRKIGEQGNMDIGIAVIPKGQELTMDDIYKAFPYLKKNKKVAGVEQINDK